MNLEVKIGGLRLSRPLIGASGLFGFGDEYAGLIDLSQFGAVITKTITARPRHGNPPPRVVDLGHGIINSIGLENPGIDWFLNEKAAGLDIDCALIVSVGGDTVDDYAVVASKLASEDNVAPLEINISCPNVDMGGISFGRDPQCTSAVVKAVRSETDLPLIAKLPPLPSCIEEVAQAASEAGADALALSNTLPALSIDIEKGCPRLGADTGGLSGPPLKPVSLFLVYKVTPRVDVPVIGIGGIETGADAVEYILAGATAFEIGSVILKRLTAPSDIMTGLEDYMDRKGYESIENFRGRALAGKEE